MLAKSKFHDFRHILAWTALLERRFRVSVITYLALHFQVRTVQLMLESPKSPKPSAEVSSETLHMIAWLMKTVFEIFVGGTRWYKNQPILFFS